MYGVNLLAPTREPSAVPSARRVAFVTVGQAPRDDVVPEIVAEVGAPLEVLEFGALDGLDRRAIAQLGPRPGDESLITRLRDGGEVIVSKRWIDRRFRELCAVLAGRDIDLVVLLSTGLFNDFHSLCMMINAQRAIDTAIQAFVLAGQRVGLMVPLACQVQEIARHGVPGDGTAIIAAMSGDEDGLGAAADRLADCDLIVLHSVGYSEADRAAVVRRTGLPVILARRVVAGAIRLLLAREGDGHQPAELAARIARLSRREREVMMLVVEGLSNKQIGAQLGISPRTVEIHRAHVMTKMEARTLSALVQAVLRLEHRDL